MSADNYYINDPNALYFVTFTVIDWVAFFTREKYKLTITDSLNYCVKNKGLTIYAWCLMFNHLYQVNPKIPHINQFFFISTSLKYCN